MSRDHRRPLQSDPIVDPAERLVLRVSTPAESKPAIKPDPGPLAAEAMQRLRHGGFECAVFEPSDDEAPRRLH
jgi:hypothetical protein